MKIVIPGGSGQVGTLLARAFHAAGDEVLVLSRSPQATPWRTAAWDAENAGPWSREIDGADVVINLAGRSVNCRYTTHNRRLILDSRVRSTRAVGDAIAKAEHPPRVWLQAGTATIYSDRYDAPNDDTTGILGGSEPGIPDTWRFSLEVARQWEAAVNEAVTSGTRKVILRSAMVMSADPGGIFATLLRLVRLRLGGRAGDGCQYVSWIHGDDFVRAIRLLIADGSLSGPINIASPEPLPYSEFMRALRDAAGVSIGLPATRWMLEIGALALQTETELILKSRRVIPERILAAGLAFQFPHWPDAAKDLCHRSAAHPHP